MTSTAYHETDFVRIAAELREAREEALRAAQRDPANRDSLRAKASRLERAADRIEADASGRDVALAISLYNED